MPTHLQAHLLFTNAKTIAKKAKELVSQRMERSRLQLKHESTLPRSDSVATDKSGFTKCGVQWLIEHFTSHQHLLCLDSFVLRNRQQKHIACRYSQA